jgi:hypothetical protein
MALTNGLVVMTPTSVAKTGASSTATINSDGSVTFGSCETLSLNGVFTSAYDNYMVVIRETASGNYNVTARLSDGGAISSTGYTWQYIQAYGTNVNGGRSASTYAIIGEDVATQRVGFTVYLYGPYLAQPTAGRSVNVLDGLSAQIVDFAWTHSVSTAYDGVRIGPTAGNITGLVTVFGFNQ